MTEAKQQTECEICWEQTDNVVGRVAFTSWSSGKCLSDTQMTPCPDCYQQIQQVVIQLLHQNIQEAVQRLEQQPTQPI